MRLTALAILLALFTGCAFGTNRVTLSPIVESSPPMAGPRTSVQARDARVEMSGATVGFKRNGYGAKTGDVRLANDQPLAQRLQGDVISILRERGYRSGGDDPSSELRCEVEVVSFSVDVKQGFWSGSLQGIAAVRIKLIDQAAGREVWNEVVRGDNEKKGIQLVSGGDHQQVVEQLYANLIGNIRSAIPDGQRPRRSTVDEPREARDRNQIAPRIEEASPRPQSDPSRLSFDECFERCTELTDRTREECFDACAKR